MARYDFGLTMAEFGRTTPGMFAELIKRQSSRFRRNCYLAGITASMVANVNRPNEQAKVWSPFDFVPDPERTKKRDSLKNKIMSVFGAMMEFNSSPDSMDKAREKIVTSLTQAGHEDVEEVFDEIFPLWEKKGIK
jgi:hypothetical protein